MIADILLWMVSVVLVLLLVWGIASILTDGCWGHDDDDLY